MPDDENGNHDNPLQEMSVADLLAELMDLMSHDGISDNMPRKILDYVERVVSEADCLTRPL